MISERLTYRAVTQADLDAFHELVTDEHIRRYLMDGNIFSREWAEERIGHSEALFRERGVGVWLTHSKSTNELLGFCGFVVIADLHPEPELVYAMPERFTGQGYATEMARACIAEARTHPGFDDLFTGVDEVNTASLHVLRKLGFEHVSTHPGHFGRTFMFRLGSEESKGNS